MQKTRKFAFLLVYVTLLSQSAWAKGWSSGGGGGIARFPEGAAYSRENILTIELYDLKDTKVAPEFLSSTEADPEAQAKIFFNKALQRLAEHSPLLVQRILDTQAQLEPWLDFPELIFPTQDFGNKNYAPNEAHIQIVVREQNKIFYDKALYEILRPLQRAALRLHEYVYAISNHPNSEKVQQVVALAFSEELPRLGNTVETRLAELYALGLQIKTLDKYKLTWPKGIKPVKEDVNGSAHYRCGYITGFNEETHTLQYTYTNKEFLFPRPSDGLSLWKMATNYARSIVNLNALFPIPGIEQTEVKVYSDLQWQALKSTIDQTSRLMKAWYLDIYYPTAKMDSAVYACMDWKFSLKYIAVRGSYNQVQNSKILKEVSNQIIETLLKRMENDIQSSLSAVNAESKDGDPEALFSASRSLSLKGSLAKIEAKRLAMNADLTLGYQDWGFGGDDLLTYIGFEVE